MTQMNASDKERVRAEAADWCARLNGGIFTESNADFERWLAQGPLHRQLFSEMTELHRFGEILRAEMQRGDAPEPPKGQDLRPGFSWAPVFALIALGLTVAVAAVMISMFRETPSVLLGANDGGATALATVAEKRTFRLRDGSTVILDARSLVTVNMDAHGRILRVEKGRARFEVIHDGRPFIVKAGNGSVRALGTIFDVSLTDEQSVRVELLRGAVEVKSYARTEYGAREAHIELAAGQSTEYSNAGRLSIPTTGRSVSTKLWTEGLVTFNGETLASVLDQANRYSAESFSVKVEDGVTGRRPVFGTLKIDDPRQLARVLARSLDLSARETSDGITLGPK